MEQQSQPDGEGVAADGKWLRDSKEVGEQQKVAVLIRHEDAQIIVQQAVEAGGSGQASVKQLLTQSDLGMATILLIGCAPNPSEH